MSNDHFDVVIIGAGLAGIGVAHHLQEKCPMKRYAILEARDTIGGTWDLFRYPGIRSDSDVHAFAYSFRRWPEGKILADGADILQYLKDVARDEGIDRHIRYHHKVKRAAWSNKTARWTLSVERTDTGAVETVTCNWLQICSGYYSYDEGYTPEFPGRDRFRGRIIHPQDWPEGFDGAGQRVAVIGSGATAITLIPALAKTADHVVMVQRSPSYIACLPESDAFSRAVRALLPKSWAASIMRRRAIFLEKFLYRNARENPEKVKDYLFGEAKKRLPDDYDFDTHFKPQYEPWDERLCMSPDGDIFKAIADGSASVVTGHIDTFTETGIRMTSGEHVEADVIITATGLKILMGGGVDYRIDDVPVVFSEAWTYRGIMFSGVPNLATTNGTLIASYTLRVELIAEYVCRLLNHMDRINMQAATPRFRPEDVGMEERPFFGGFQAGYIQRWEETAPKQGDKEPWVNLQSYEDNKVLLTKPLDDGVMTFTLPG